MSAAPPRRLSVQVCANPDGSGFIGYVPQTDTEVIAPTFDGAKAVALEAARNEPEVPPVKIDPVTRWTCNNGHENPPGRTDCSTCGTPQL